VSVPADRRDEILQRLLLEESSPLEAFDRSELAGDAAARAELEELLESARRLDSLGADARAANARGPVDPAAEERVLTRFREHLASETRPRRPRLHGGRLAALIAACLVLLLGVRFLFPPSAEPHPDTPLGPGTHLEILAPVGDVDSFAEITWSGELPSRARFVVRVYDGASGAELAASPPLEENRWLPAEETWTKWPADIRLRVELLGEGPDELLARSCEARARLSP
jgi:hypothetical protein